MTLRPSARSSKARTNRFTRGNGAGYASFCISKTIPIYLDRAMLRAHDRLQAEPQRFRGAQQTPWAVHSRLVEDNFVRRIPDENLPLLPVRHSASVCCSSPQSPRPPPTHNAAGPFDQSEITRPGKPHPGQPVWHRCPQWRPMQRTGGLRAWRRHSGLGLHRLYETVFCSTPVGARPDQSGSLPCPRVHNDV